MKLRSFTARTAKEILRDPLTLIFGLGFPLVLLFLLSAIQASIPVDLFEIDRLTPGLTVFGLSFLTLFSATLIARDRESALLQRLYTTPLTAPDFILGYTLPILPIALAQCAVCYLAALPLGLTPRIGTLYALLFILPTSLVYIALGLLCGSVFSVRQVGGVGGAFQRIADALPFVHAVRLEQAALNGDWSGLLPHLWWVLGYGIGLSVLAVALFYRQMRRQ